MVGPYQVPVADLALTCHSFQGYTGSAMAMGERTPLALMDAPASGRMAIAEAVTNIAAAHIGPIHRIKLSGNWMCACGEEGEDAALYDTVRAVGVEFCPAVGVSIPVGQRLAVHAGGVGRRRGRSAQGGRAVEFGRLGLRVRWTMCAATLLLI